jgi:hypothetical protein
MAPRLDAHTQATSLLEALQAASLVHAVHLLEGQPT